MDRSKDIHISYFNIYLQEDKKTVGAMIYF